MINIDTNSLLLMTISIIISTYIIIYFNNYFTFRMFYEVNTNTSIINLSYEITSFYY